MLITVVIPTYRRTALLNRCIKALFEQRFDNTQFEIIVVSDGPDAETQNILNNWCGYNLPVLRFMPLSQKKGPAAARNHGWQNASGQIIAFTDDDCIPDNNWLSEIAKHCHAHEDVAITGKVIVPISEEPTDYELNISHLETADFITANCACTKNALIKAGGFDERFRMAWREDSDLHFKLMTNAIHIKKVKTAIVTHPVREAVWGVSIKDQKKTMFDALLYKKYPILFRKKIQSGSPLLYYGIILAFVIMAIGFIIANTGMGLAGLITWLALTLFFTFKRLRNTRLSASHMAEMLVTSAVIPFCSIYWQWYGAAKFKVLYI
jgi:glycosyltransferase involved in cell wall biosynthesis